MKKRAILTLLGVASAVFAGAPRSIVAQAGNAFEVVHSFSGASNGANGLIASADGGFWGTTSNGGEFGRGAIFRLDPAAGGQFTFTVVHDFFDYDGIQPQGLSQGPEGDYWGVTLVGGGAGVGCLYRIDATGHFTQVHRFNNDDGANPVGPPQAAPDQAVYGTTASGGVYGNGTVYRVDPSGIFAKIHDFTGADGRDPEGRLLFASDGFFYGTTAAGGTNDNGTVFRMDLQGNVSTLYSFAGPAGGGPHAGLVEVSGSLYGTTEFGGDAGSGTLFRRDADGTVTILHSFSGGADGGLPVAELVAAVDGSGTLLGATSSGGVGGGGTIFAADLSGTVTPRHAFDGATGNAPVAAVIPQLDGSLFGTTIYGGPYYRGTVFQLDAADQWSVVADFRVDEGSDPSAPLSQGFDGALYGATTLGGTAGKGTLFRLDPQTGAFSTLHGFSGPDGANPGLGAGLLPASDGNYYGTTYSEGANGFGTIFRLDSGAVLTTMHDFTSDDGALPVGMLTESGGALYGETSNGGTSDLGTVFSLGLLGAFASIHSFSGPDGAGAYGGLVDAGDGSFFGTTGGGGGANWGVVFHMTPDGTPATVHDVGSSDGVQPLSAPVLRSGSLYVTSSGNTAIIDFGSVFRVDPSGQNFLVVHHFSGGDGASPQAGLVLADDGNLYGTASSTVFRVDGSDDFSVIHQFDGLSDGYSVASALFQASDDALYGTAKFGGVNNTGTIYRVLLNVPPPSIASLTPMSGTAEGGTAFEARGDHFRRSPSVTFGIQAANVFEPDTKRLLGLSPAMPAGSLSDLVITNSDATSVTLPAAWFSDFLDVPHLHIFHDFVESIVRAGITAGCGAGLYCPDQGVTRAQMAVFLLKASLGAAYVPPVVAQVFDDVPPGSFACDWINDLYGRGITGGCSVTPALYCPEAHQTRGQMAVFLAKTFQLP